jgi:hypothetical protein
MVNDSDENDGMYADTRGSRLVQHVQVVEMDL